MTTQPEKPTDPRRRLKEVNAKLEDAEARLTALMEEDRSSYAQGIMDKLFTEFVKGKRWLDRMGQLASEKYYVYSPIGRRRFMPAGLTGDRKIIAKQVRRGTNAPVQGFASEIGTKASRRIMETYYDECKHIAELAGFKVKKPSKFRIYFNRIVHDASYLTVPYFMVIPMIHILQWEATYGITKAYKDEFGVEFAVEPEIEIELAARDDRAVKWDWSIPNLVECINKVLDDLVELGNLTTEEKPEVLAEIFAPWRSREARLYLQDKFPLLNVRDLDDEIRSAIPKS